MFLSTSKTGTTQLAASVEAALSLRPIDPEVEQRMELMYPAGKQRSAFETLGRFVASTVSRVYAAFDVLGYICDNADTFEDDLDAGGNRLAENTQAMVAQRAESINILLNSSKMTRDMKGILGSNMANSSGAIIEGSRRFNGGYDIVMSGVPCPQTPIAALGNFNVLKEQGSNRPRIDKDAQFESKNMSSYQSDIAQNAIRAAKQLHVAIFGSERSGGDSLFYASMDKIPLDFNWEQLNNILYSVHPSLTSIDINLFQNLDKSCVDILGGFMQIGLRSVPGQNLLDRKIRNLKQDIKTPVEVNDVNLAIDVRVEGGLILNVEKEIADYICQGATDLTTMCLYRWFQSWAEYYCRVQGATRTGNVVRRAAIPRYVTSATLLPMLKQLREKVGFSVHQKIADDNGLTIMPDGTMSVLPSRDDIDTQMVSDYEHDLNSVLNSLFSKGIPLSTEHNTLRSNLYAAREQDLDIDVKVQERAQSLSKYSSICIGIDPDFAVIVETSSTGGISVNSTRTVGAKIPGALDTADMLGYDFAEPGEAPAFRNISSILDLIANNSRSVKYTAAQDLLVAVASQVSGSGRYIEGVRKDRVEVSSAGNLDLLTLASQAIAMYGLLMENHLAPNINVLIQESREEMGLSDSDAELNSSPYDVNLYSNVINNDFSTNVSVPDTHIILEALLRVLNDAAGLRGSNLVNVLMREMGNDITAALDARADHPNGFAITPTTKLSDMSRLNNYFGGTLFKRMCIAVAGADRKKLFSLLSASATAPAASRVMNQILPLCTLIGNIVPNSLEIFEQAESDVERLKPDTSITAEDIVIPGLRSGTQMMPHQLAAHQTLRRRPKYATLFIAPGGGKTFIGVTDIAATMKELDDLGEEPLRPLVVCPSNLATTWADDTHKFLDGWNVIAITSDTVNTWGEERLYDIISQAPRNTIFVVGLSFIQTGTMNVDIGGVRVRIRGAVEFVNRMGFNYALIDESHKAKNFSGGQSGSQVHFNAKAIFTAPSIRYARIATGTLVTDRVSDVVGQAALLTPAIFGDNLDVADLGDGSTAMIRRTHSRLSNHTAFISFKRKAWAFMLPNPIDTFIPVDIADPTVPHSDLHKQVYDAMYTEVLTLLDKAASEAKRKSSGDDDDEESDNDGDDASGIDESELSDGDILGSLLASSADLNLYFQRMEMLLTDPMGDDIARETFARAGVTDFVSAKVRTIIDRIRKHFEVQDERDIEDSTQQVFQWKPGVTPRELDMAVFNGVKYLARKQSDTYKRQQLPPSMTPPPDDPEYWKEEVQGKLIIFTRYTRSANAIYNALPEQYKRVAVLFHGEVGKLGQDKVANLDAFKTNSDVQIIIANEQAISEGHNMQMGSRIIRCDTPWSPGVYDQSTARIFRPDVAAAEFDENGRPGDMKREVVFIDWVMTTNTLEVGKVARLMWKTLEKTQFDEKGNERYADIDKYQLEPIKMNRELLVNNNTIEDFIDYFKAKRDLNDIETAEFTEMRKTTAASMIPLEPSPALRDFRVIDQFPILANQKIPDRNNWGLLRMLDWARDNSFASGEMLKNACHLMPVVTEFGNGVIVGVNVRNVDGKLKADAPISTVRVRLAGTEDLVSIPATKVHLATKVNKGDMETFFRVRKPWATEQDRKRANAEANAVEVEDTIEDEVQTSNTNETRKQVEAVERKTARAKKRAENIAEKKPVNEGVKEAAKRVRRVNTLPTLNNTVRKASGKLSLPGQSDVEPDMALELTPTVYNGFVALYADSSDPDAANLGKYDFIQFGSYVYIDLYYYADFEKLLDYIEGPRKLEFDKASTKRLEFIQDVFAGRNLSFNVAQATHIQSSLKQFFQMRHRAATDKNHVKCYPMVMEDRLRIMFDLTTNPKIRKVIGQKLPGARKFGSFEQSPGMWIAFTPSVAKAKLRVTKLVKAGYEISNLKACVKSLDKLKITSSKNTSV